MNTPAPLLAINSELQKIFEEIKIQDFFTIKLNESLKLHSYDKKNWCENAQLCGQEMVSYIEQVNEFFQELKTSVGISDNEFTNNLTYFLNQEEIGPLIIKDFIRYIYPENFLSTEDNEKFTQEIAFVFHEIEKNWGVVFDFDISQSLKILYGQRPVLYGQVLSQIKHTVNCNAWELDQNNEERNYDLELKVNMYLEYWEKLPNLKLNVDRSFLLFITQNSKHKYLSYIKNIENTSPAQITYLRLQNLKRPNENIQNYLSQYDIIKENKNLHKSIQTPEVGQIKRKPKI